MIFRIIKINTGSNCKSLEKIKIWLVDKGCFGSLALGALFALAFCPYSGVLFFGGLILLVLMSGKSLLLPSLFALGTGLPVIIFSFLIVFSMQKASQAFQIAQKAEKVMRYGVALITIFC